MILSRRQHEVIDRELAAAAEEIGERDPAGWTFEDIGLVDPDPGHFPAFGPENIELACHLLFHDWSDLRAFSQSARDTLFGAVGAVLVTFTTPICSETTSPLRCPKDVDTTVDPTMTSEYFPGTQ